MFGHCPSIRHYKPLRMLKTVNSVGLPNPELYILVSGKPSKQKVLWQSMVNIAQVRAAVQKLKQINWLYANIDDSSVDDASRRIVETTRLVQCWQKLLLTMSSPSSHTVLDDWIRNSQALLIVSISSS